MRKMIKMKQFNLIEISAIVSKQFYLSTFLPTIDEVYNPKINEYGIMLHLNYRKLREIHEKDRFLDIILGMLLTNFIKKLKYDYNGTQIIYDIKNQLILIY